MSDYLVILRPAPLDFGALNGAGVPAEQRLRRALKFAGRGCRLKCVHLEEIQPGDVAGVIGAVKALKRRLIPVG